MLSAAPPLRCCVVGAQPLPLAHVPGLFVTQGWCLVCLDADPGRGVHKARVSPFEAVTVRRQSPE